MNIFRSYTPPFLKYWSGNDIIQMMALDSTKDPDLDLQPLLEVH